MFTNIGKQGREILSGAAKGIQTIVTKDGGEGGRIGVYYNTVVSPPKGPVYAQPAQGTLQEFNGFEVKCCAVLKNF
jgi:hypothetical protein